jgi:NAD+ dependent glucose-6-phosphate dehydrogenase
VNKQVGITGAAGRVGTILTGGLSAKYSLTLIDKRQPQELIPHGCRFVNVDLSVAEDINGTFSGLDAVVHLAANANPQAPWESVLANNIVATYNVFEEAHRAGVRKIVFASTNHVQRGYVMVGSSSVADDLSIVEKNGLIKTTDPPAPDSLYGVSKLFGEDLGRYYSRLFGIQFVALRIGSVSPEHIPVTAMQNDKYIRDHFLAMFLSKKDLVDVFDKALQAPKSCITAYAVSNNNTPVFDLTSTGEELNFHPADSSADFYKNIV